MKDLRNDKERPSGASNKGLEGGTRAAFGSGERKEEDKNLVQKAGDKLERSGDRMEHSKSDLKNKVGDTIEKTGDKIERAGDKLERNRDDR